MQAQSFIVVRSFVDEWTHIKMIQFGLKHHEVQSSGTKESRLRLAEIKTQIILS